jgi:hypothetical protein
MVGVRLFLGPPIHCESASFLPASLRILPLPRTNQLRILSHRIFQAPMQRTMDDRYKDFQAKMAGNERAQRELQRLLDNSDKMPEQQSAAELLPVEEMEERLQYINMLEKHWHDNFARLSQKPGEAYRSFNDAELSALLHMDTGYLRDKLMQYSLTELLIQDIQGIPATLKICKYPAPLFPALRLYFPA